MHIIYEFTQLELDRHIYNYKQLVYNFVYNINSLFAFVAYCI